MELLCKKCLRMLSEDEFGLHKGLKKRNGRDSRCRECKSKRASELRISRQGDRLVDRVFTERWQGVRDRSKKKGWDVYYDANFLKELFEKQNHKCAVSGIEMTTIFAKGRVPTNVSVDRIDTNLPYTKENTQLVCMAVNQMKSDLTKEELLFFCTKILQNESKDTKCS